MTKINIVAGKNKEWWKASVFYQVFPASFYDSNGDGYGDLRGIIMKLDYLSWLGVDALWLSPVFESPFFDMGYDVTDYLSVNPIFGNLGDLRELLSEAHKKGIRIILDLVLNHTSIEHPWFQESRSSITNPKRDWYIWNKGSSRRKPNNWKSLYGGSAWSFDATTGEYYYHTFFKEQPDLNWRNQDVRRHFFNIVRFWVDLGVDGFRLDVINVIVKDRELRNSPPPFLYQLLGRENYVTRNQRESFNVIQELREVVDEYAGTLLLGEIYTLPPGNPGLVSVYLNGKQKRLHLAFNFSLMFSSWSAGKYHNAVVKWMNHIPDEAWPCHVLSNHDLNRSLGFEWFTNLSDKKAKVMATLLLTLKGTPFIYYGEEIAMRNSFIPKRRIIDPLGKRFWPLYMGRDPSRTPMQWDARIHGGFSEGEPWLPLHRGWPIRNVSNQMADGTSILMFYRELLELRKSRHTLQYGDWIPVITGENNILAYLRTSSEEQILIVLNFSRRSRRIRINHYMEGTVLISTNRSTSEKIRLTDLRLFPFESTILQIR